ncbi:MAG: carboxypeptidase-like regulatory domain-containing protein [Desulfocapsaceae bacterium]|jgi:hypothetical protein|nr:carboxypeptidase-like regulatory domain-containing protein [Desulfocapsaceae bacterium]
MLRSIFINRYTITFGFTVAIALLWNLFVIFNDSGILNGRVVDQNNQPIGNARVVLSEKTLLVTAPRDEVVTDADGYFRFEGHKLYHLYLEVSTDDLGSSSSQEVRLYFKGQNKILKKPLVLEPHS